MDNIVSLRKILLVEDDDKDAELISSVLNSVGTSHSMTRVEDGEEAIKYLNEAPELPAVILLDLKLPKVDGFEVLKHVRENGRLKRIPVVVLTSSKEEKDLKNCYNLLANAYVVKPLNTGEFIKTVNELGNFWAGVNEPPPINIKG